jgi:uncharacterized membrane protein YgdD (TMEM256/DUF423 family)
MMAAYVDHSLVALLSSQALTSVLTAVRYHQLYAIVICVIGLAVPLQSNRRIKTWLARTAWTFITGITLFSFGIYGGVILNIAGIIYLTPVGGVLLMAGWCSLIRTAFLVNK